MQNAFSVALSPFGFDFHQMLTVDLLHEVELGVWKVLLIHLIWMLHACGADKVHEFDKWYGPLHVHELEYCQNHSMDAGSARAKGLVLRGRTIDVFTP